MNRQYSAEDNEKEGQEEDERFSCPETGAHFEFLEMCARLKRLQKKRIIVEKAIEEAGERTKQNKL